MDLVGSTALLAGTDPEIARQRVTRFFSAVSQTIEAHGGTVEKFAGDTVMAAFGIPRVHEDDAERALRAALEIRAVLSELGIECTVGVDAGEVVSEDSDSTFATGQAVNVAARLQEVAEPNEILVGNGAYRLASHAIELVPAGERVLPGFAEPVAAWRAVSALERRGRPLGAFAAPLVGREAELALLRNIFERTVRDRRAHLFTIYGEPGVGKSRLAREFVAGLEGATVLVGRCLPYGEGITYWPLAEMVKAAAEIADDDPVEEAYEKLLVLCEDESVADLLGLVSGLPERIETDRSQQEIAWAAREWARKLAGAKPLLLGFEDIHWAEEPMLTLIEHLAASVRDAPLIVLCLARPELLGVYPAWGAGRAHGTAIELTALMPADAERLVDTLIADVGLSSSVRSDVLAKIEGNPLFAEETVRMLAEGANGRTPIPDTVHALIAARIDGLPGPERTLLQRAAVIGRVFWRGALAQLAPDVEEFDDALDGLFERDFLLQESRSSITGEQAFRFKHILIHEIAYSGLSKSARAELHAAFAAWLHERGVEELVEIRAYHLDQSAALASELSGVVPEELARDAAAALEAAGRRALAREANRSGRNLLLRAVELESTLERRYQAARAAWRLADLPAVSVEMERVRADAREAGDRRIEGRALIALGEVTAFRDVDSPRSRELVESGLALLEPDDFIGRFDAFRQLCTLARWAGKSAESLRYGQQAFYAARETGRKDLMSWAAYALADSYIWEFELDRPVELAAEGLRLADESGAIAPRGLALYILAQVAKLKGDADEAVRLYEQAMTLFAEAGAVLDQGRCINHLAEVLMARGEDDRAERLLREAIQMLSALSDRGYLCESFRLLAEILVRRGRLDEAEQAALEGVRTVGPQDRFSLPTTRMALGLVRDAQGRAGEAERLLREAVDLAADGAPVWIYDMQIRCLARFLEAHGRPEEAAALEARIAASPA